MPNIPAGVGETWTNQRRTLRIKIARSMGWLDVSYRPGIRLDGLRVLYVASVNHTSLHFYLVFVASIPTSTCRCPIGLGRHLQSFHFSWPRLKTTLSVCAVKQTSAPYSKSICVCVCVCVCFLPIHSGHQVRWTYQPGSHRISHPPSFCGACLNFSREKDSAFPFPHRL